MEKTPEGRIIVCCPTDLAAPCQSQRRAAPGTCIPLPECKQIHAMFLHKPMSVKTADFLRKSQCGFANGKPQVCCTEDDKNNAIFEEERFDRTTTATTTTTTMETPVTAVDETTLEGKIGKKSKLLPKAPVCGSELASRIFGGTETTIYEFNWLVLLQYSKRKWQKIFMFKK